MPVCVAKSGRKYIIVECRTGKRVPHTPEHDTRTAAEKQARAINANLRKQGKI
ncbi:MAG: hypothetical protein KatS3mg087_1322 [Patescibacteria group bacterium]|nr:MAG: hypothetical protein KatS3mg087_1322 [Patescibacteria group bacterium]